MNYPKVFSIVIIALVAILSAWGIVSNILKLLE